MSKTGLGSYNSAFIEQKKITQYDLCKNPFNFNVKCVVAALRRVFSFQNRTTLKTARRTETRRMALSRAQICRLHPDSTGMDAH